MEEQSAALGALLVLWVVFMWLATTGFCAWLAKQKLRSPLAWGLWGLVFGPLALLTLVGAPVATGGHRDTLETVEAGSWADPGPFPVIAEHKPWIPRRRG